MRVLLMGSLVVGLLSQSGVAGHNHAQVLELASRLHQSCLKLELVARDTAPGYAEQMLAQRLVRKSCAIVDGLQAGHSWPQVECSARSVGEHVAMLAARLSRYCPSDVNQEFMVAWQCVSQDWAALSHCLAGGSALGPPAQQAIPSAPFGLGALPQVPFGATTQQRRAGFGSLSSAGINDLQRQRAFSSQAQVNSGWNQGPPGWATNRSANPFASQRVQPSDVRAVLIESLLRRMLQ